MVVLDYSELGYPDGPEMNEYKLQLQQFVSEWEKMKSGLIVTHCTLEIGRKSPENLLQDMIQQMDSECKATQTKSLLYVTGNGMTQVPLFFN